LEAIAAIYRGDSVGHIVGGLSAGAIVSFVGFKWKTIKLRMGPRFTQIATNVATDFRWWLAWVFVVFIYLGMPSFIGAITRATRQQTAPVLRSASATDVARPNDKATALACPPASASAMELNSAKSQIDHLQQQLAQANAQITALQHPAIASMPIQSTGPISWNSSFGTSQTTDANGDPIFPAIIFSGTNSSSMPVQLKDAYIVSNMTGAKETLQVNMGYGPEHLAAIGDINQIPPKAQIELWALFNPVLHASDWVANWGAFRFHADYGDSKYDNTFDEQAIINYLSRYPNAHVGPHITKKSDH
jgi:hypothetical protein